MCVSLSGLREEHRAASLDASMTRTVSVCARRRPVGPSCKAPLLARPAFMWLGQ